MPYLLSRLVKLESDVAGLCSVRYKENRSYNGDSSNTSSTEVMVYITDLPCFVRVSFTNSTAGLFIGAGNSSNSAIAPSKPPKAYKGKVNPNILQSSGLKLSICPGK